MTPSLGYPESKLTTCTCAAGSGGAGTYNLPHHERCPAFLRLFMQADAAFGNRALVLLRALEWSGDEFSCPCCLAAAHVDDAGEILQLESHHHPGCELGAILAGVKRLTTPPDDAIAFSSKDGMV